MVTQIDAHAHFYPCFDIGSYLASAVENFRRSATEPTDGVVGVLLLATPQATDAPLAPLERALAQLPAAWQVTRPDSTSILFRRDNQTIVCIAGRQLTTQENLELLMLCSDQPFPVQQPLAAAVSECLRMDAVPVVPWGFGKWWFRRGRVLRDYLQNASTNDTQRVFLGDSGCRPALCTPMPLRKTNRISILAGSDPLPIPAHQHRVGCLGTALTAAIDLDQPTTWMRQQLSVVEDRHRFGHLRSLPGFLADQLRIRIHHPQ